MTIKKKAARILFLLLTMALIAVLFACTNNNAEEGSNDNQEDVYLESIQVDRDSIPEKLYAGRVDLTSIDLILRYSNGTTETVTMQEDYIALSGRNKLFVIGTHQFDVYYQDCVTSFQLTLLDPNIATYILEIQGGIPVSVNGVSVFVPVPETGVYTGVFENGDVVVISWIQERNKSFSRWLVDGTPVDNQSTTTVEMTGNYVYRAEAVDIVYTVSFITNKENYNIAAKTIKRLYREGATFDMQNIYYDSLPMMTMDDYVFAGWTASAISYDQSLSGAGTFPLLECETEDESGEYYFSVENNIVLYAVWTPVRLDFIDYTPSVSGYTQTSGKKVNRYDGTLTDLIIPATYAGMPVLAISRDAFTGANAAYIESITIPASVIEIDEGTFRNCSSLRTINVEQGSNFFSSENGVLYKDERATIFAYPASKVARIYEMETTVSAIASYAFYNTVIGSVVVAPNIVSIGDHAFDSVHIDSVDFSAVNTALIGSSRAHIGNDIFSDNVSSIVITSMDEDVAVYSRLKCFMDMTDKFTGGLDVHSVYTYQYSSDVTILFRLISSGTLGKYFENTATTAEIIGVSRAVSGIDIPDKLFTGINSYPVSSIGYYAFKDCLSLTSVVLPSDLERIVDKAFDDTPWAKSLNNDCIIANNTLYKYLGSSAVFSLPDKVVKIAESAFWNNKSLEFINISSNDTLEKICAKAFMNCENLAGFSKDEDISDHMFYIKSSVKTIDAYSFYNTALRVILSQEGSSLEKVGEYAFAGCKYLTSFSSTSAALSQIETTSFLDTESLTSFDIAVDNDIFATFDGVLYQMTGNSVATLFTYPSGRLCDEFDPSFFEKKIVPVRNGIFTVFGKTYTVSEADSGETYVVGKYEDDSGIHSYNLVKEGDVCYINVTVNVLGENAFRNANVGALVISNDIQSISKLYIRGLVYVTVTRLSSINYHSIFAAGCEPDYVYFPTLEKENVSGFFNSDVALCDEKYRNVKPVTFFTDEGAPNFLWYKKADEIVLCKSVRNRETLTVPEEVTFGSDSFQDKTIAKYAFGGWYLKTLTFEKSVTEIAAFAMDLTHVLEEITLDENRIDSIPTAVADSFGPTFNNGLLLQIRSGMSSSYLLKWEFLEKFTYRSGDEDKIACSYLIENRLPFAVLTYKDDNNVVVTVGLPIYGSITTEHIRTFKNDPSVQKDGYEVGGWTNEKDVSIDISSVYTIPYNQVLSCVWTPRVYTVYLYLNNSYEPGFDVTETDENNYYKTEVTFHGPYEWDISGYDKRYKALRGWLCQLSGGERSVDMKGNWVLVLDADLDAGRRIVFMPQLTDRKYSLVYRTDDELANLTKEVTYGSSYTLDIPSKDGYTFRGWYYNVSQTETLMLTDERGKSVSDWSLQIALNDQYDIYPLWQANPIQVSLYSAEGEETFIKDVTVEFGSNDFVISPDGIFDEENSGMFSGWADANGVIYTDAFGVAIRKWDKSIPSKLYAVWPQNVGDLATLISVLSASMSASILLTDDIEISDRYFGNPETPYTGVFNGNGHKIIYSDTTTGSAYAGLFIKNEGTIKNLVFEVESINKNIRSADYSSSYVYFGTICAINSGIINVDIKIKNMSVTIDDKAFCFDDKSSNYHIGVVCAWNEGKITGSCNYAYDSQAVYYRDSSDAAVSSYASGEWGIDYTHYYIYQDNAFVKVYVPFDESAEYYTWDSENSEYKRSTSTARQSYEDGKWEIVYSQYYTRLGESEYSVVKVPFDAPQYSVSDTYYIYENDGYVEANSLAKTDFDEGHWLTTYQKYYTRIGNTYARVKSRTVYYKQVEDIFKNQRLFNVGGGTNKMTFILQEKK